MFPHAAVAASSSSIFVGTFKRLLLRYTCASVPYWIRIRYTTACTKILDNISF